MSVVGKKSLMTNKPNVQVETSSSVQVLSPQCTNPSCMSFNVEPYLRCTEKEEWIEIGYLCECHRFLPCDSVYQWLAIAAIHPTNMMKNILPKEASTLTEAVKLWTKDRVNGC